MLVKMFFREKSERCRFSQWFHHQFFTSHDSRFSHWKCQQLTWPINFHIYHISKETFSSLFHNSLTRGKKNCKFEFPFPYHWRRWDAREMCVEKCCWVPTYTPHSTRILAPDCCALPFRFERGTIGANKYKNSMHHFSSFSRVRKCRDIRNFHATMRPWQRHSTRSHSFFVGSGVSSKLREKWKHNASRHRRHNRKSDCHARRRDSGKLIWEGKWKRA